MTGVIDHGCSNYSHGIISTKCIAKVYLDLEMEVKQIERGTFVQVHSIRNDDVLFCIVGDDMQVDCRQMICKKEDIINVPENLWGPLFTVGKDARLPLVRDSKIAESIGNISVGHNVQVLGPDNSVLCIANVTFRNSIGRLGVGIYFGLEVLRPRESLSEIKEKVSLLEPGTKGFPRGCDIVVSVDKLLPFNCSFYKEKFTWSNERENEKQQMKNIFCQEDLGNESHKVITGCCAKDKIFNDIKKGQHKSSPELSQSLKKMINSDNPLNVGDEVIYLDGDTPEKGVVRWMGLLENSLKVGVEFENPIGNGTGAVQGVGELFHTKYKHSLIVPPMALIKLSDYMVNGLKENYHVEKNHTNSNNNNSIYKSIKPNNNNCINNNNEYITSSDTSFSNQESVEEKLKKWKKISVSHQCPKHVEKSFNSNNSSQTIHKEDEFSRNESVKNQWRSDVQGWTSLDSGRWERRTSSRGMSSPAEKNVTKIELSSSVNGNNTPNVRRYTSSVRDTFNATDVRRDRTYGHCCSEVPKCLNGEDDCSFYKTAVCRADDRSVRNFHEGWKAAGKISVGSRLSVAVSLLKVDGVELKHRAVKK